ncbi:hypothetical protein KIPB_013537, partial [Kipferlia bialata]|eukprot:g13537.t1
MSGFLSLKDYRREVKKYSVTRLDPSAPPTLEIVSHAAWTVFKREYQVYLGAVSDEDQAYTLVDCIETETREAIEELTEFPYVPEHYEGEGDQRNQVEANTDEWIAATDAYWKGLSWEEAIDRCRALTKPKLSGASIMEYYKEFAHIRTHTEADVKDDAAFVEALAEEWIEGLPNKRFRRLVKRRLKKRKHDFGVVTRTTMSMLDTFIKAKQLANGTYTTRNATFDDSDSEDDSDSKDDSSDDDLEADVPMTRQNRRRQGGKRDAKGNGRTGNGSDRTERDTGKGRNGKAANGNNNGRNGKRRGGRGQGQQRQQGQGPLCYACNKPGHRAGNCPLLQEFKASRGTAPVRPAPAAPTPPQRQQNFHCWKCGDPSHNARQCPSRDVIEGLPRRYMTAAPQQQTQQQRAVEYYQMPQVQFQPQPLPQPQQVYTKAQLRQYDTRAVTAV